MSSVDYAEAIKALGFNPPGGDDHDLERTYHELVRNVAAQGGEVPEGHAEASAAYFEGFGEPTGDHVVGVEA